LKPAERRRQIGQIDLWGAQRYDFAITCSALAPSCANLEPKPGALDRNWRHNRNNRLSAAELLLNVC
jgi:hypothetical protein